MANAESLPDRNALNAGALLDQGRPVNAHVDDGHANDDHSHIISQAEAAQLIDLMPDENGEAEGRPMPTGV